MGQFGAMTMRIPSPARWISWLPLIFWGVAQLSLPLCARADAITPSSDRGWRDYQILMWQPQTRRQYATLKSIGLTGGEVHLVDRDRPEQLPRDDIARLSANHLRWYVENIATDFYSPYHRWFPDRAVNWKFQQVKTLYRDNPLDIRAFVREPSLADPQWLSAIRDRLTRVVRAERPYRPLFYNLGDETGIGELSIFWDFDLSMDSLAGMRDWLKTQYETLAALNAEWGTDFDDWGAVMPLTTQQAMARTDENYAAWADFKAWMDVSFARALRAGTDAVHASDPQARAAIEGAQIPGWGGYDYTQLSRAVDVMELYDGGGNLEIMRSLNPGMILLTTTAGGGRQEVYDIWREALRGSRGVILWDPNDQFAAKDGKLGPRGIGARGVFRELRNGVGALLINSERRFDPIAILYSPASMRTQWMLDWRPLGDAWATRDISASYEDENEVRDSMMAYSRALESFGLHPRFLSRALVEEGALQDHGYRVLILPRVLSLAREEADKIRAFVEAGGLVIADTEPGIFDEHSRRLPESPLADLFRAPADTTGLGAAGRAGIAVYAVPDGEHCLGDSAETPCPAEPLALSALLKQRGLEPAATLRRPTGEAVANVETYEFRNGALRLLALQRAWPSADRDRRPGSTGEAREAVVLTLPEPAFVHDVLSGRALGYGQRFDLALDGAEPSILAYSKTQLPGPTIAGPRQLRRGQTGLFAIGFSPGSPEDYMVLHGDVIDPAGRVVEAYSGNLAAAHGRLALRLPLAPNDPLGTWQIHVTDPVTRERATLALQVVP